MLFRSGIILLLNRFDKIQLRVIISLLVVFTSFIIILDGINTIDLNLIERMKSGLELSRANRGGGVLGSFFGFFLYRLFGSIGTYIVLAFSIMISLLVVTNLTIKEVLSKAKDITPNIVNRESKHVKPISRNTDAEYNDNENTKIKITDYTAPAKPTPIKLEEKQVIKETKNIDGEIKYKHEKVQKTPYRVPPLNILASPKIKNDRKFKTTL